ncbi:class II aldolase/adducin family protein [Elusimicrobiota bacterium]
MENFKVFQRAGGILFQQGLISAAAGNISIKKDKSIFITASGSLLGDLQISDIVEAPIEGTKISNNYSIYSKKPSIEIEVHKAIYRNTPHKAIVHAHPPTAIALSFNVDKIELEDSEGRIYIPVIPVLAVNGGISSTEVAKRIPDLLNEYAVVLVKGHGAFAASDTLMKACSLMSTLEFSSVILYRKKLFES